MFDFLLVTKSFGLVQHIAVAYDMMATLYQAELRDAQKRIAALEAQVSALGGG